MVNCCVVGCKSRNTCQEENVTFHRAQNSERKQHRYNFCPVHKKFVPIVPKKEVYTVQKPDVSTENPPQIICRINPAYPGAVTRSVSKILDYLSDFIIIEVYRCMPLLGDEGEKAPDWDIHIVRYAIVFTKSFMKPNRFNGF